MTQRLIVAICTVALVLPTAATAQDNPVISSLNGLYNITKTNIAKTAEMLDEDLYAYRPTEEVRSVGELLAHIAGAQYLFCASASGQDSPNSENFEETRSSKAEIVDALTAGFAYCDGVFAHLTDAQASNAVSFFGNPNTVAGVLAFNSAHNYEHYGNLVTYMRINGITPPSSM